MRLAEGQVRPVLIIPTALFRLMQDPDPAKSKQVMEAILQMKKIDIAGLERTCSQE